MKILKKLILLSLVPVLATGCIKEDMDDCENVAISFRYLADGDDDVLRQYMDKIDLYVFDSGNRLVEQLTYNQNALNRNGNDPTFRLSPGKYHMVAVGNPYGKTAVEDVNSADFSKIFIQHPGWTPGSTLEGQDHNYMGSKEITVPDNNRYARDTIYMRSSHVNVEIEIHGLPAPGTARAGMPYKISIENSNALTDFNNEVDKAGKYTCTPELAYDAGTGVYHTSGLSLFRMDTGGELSPEICRHVLRLEDSHGNVLVTQGIYDYIKRYSGIIDVARQEALLPIRIEFGPVGVIVKVPSWYVEDVTPGWSESEQEQTMEETTYEEHSK